MSPTDTDKPIAASGTFTFGAHTVHRLGYGAMQLTGPGIWGPPRDHDEAIRVLRRAVELGVDFIDTADSYGPYVSEELIREALHPYDHVRHRHQGGAHPDRPGRVAAGRPARVPAAGVRDEPAPPRPRAHRPLPAAPHRPQGARRASSSASSRSCRTRARSTTFGLSEVTVADIEAARRVLPVATVQNLYNLGNRQSEAVLVHCEAEGIGFIPWFPLASGQLVEPGGAVAEVAAAVGATPARSRWRGCCTARP